MRVLRAVDKANSTDLLKAYRDIQATVWKDAKVIADEQTLPFDEFQDTANTNPQVAGIMKTYQAMQKSTSINATYRRVVGTFLTTMTNENGRPVFGQALYRAVSELVGNGTNRIDFISKRGNRTTRRTDSSVRNALMTEFTTVVKGLEGTAAEAIGSDAWEISAHAHCAEDHEDVQGKVFTAAEYEKLQSPARDTDGAVHLLRRPIGMWKCRHMAIPLCWG